MLIFIRQHIYNCKSQTTAWLKTSELNLIEKEDGGRIYSFEVPRKLGWKAKYLKEVNSEEVTIRFWQEIYDEHNILREIHEKYPVDKGHKKL